MKKAMLIVALLSFPNIAFGGCKVSKEKYDALNSGISYQQAVSILGCEGEEISRSDMAGYVTVMYMWYGGWLSGANMNAMFQNNKLVAKAQIGLR